MLKSLRRQDNKPVRLGSALPKPVAGGPLWDQGAWKDVAANLRKRVSGSWVTVQFLSSW